MRVLTYKVLRSAFHPPSNLMKFGCTGVRTRIERTGTRFRDPFCPRGTACAKKVKIHGGCQNFFLMGRLLYLGQFPTLLIKVLCWKPLVRRFFKKICLVRRNFLLSAPDSGFPKSVALGVSCKVPLLKVSGIDLKTITCPSGKKSNTPHEF